MKRTEQPYRMSALKLGILMLLSLALPVSAAAPSLNTVETQLFGRHYDGDPVDERLARLESIFYGDAQTGEVAEREQKLLRLWEQTAPPASVQTSDSTNLQPSASPLEQTLSETPATKPREATDYPAVTALEKQVFHQVWAGEDIANRLARLEQEVFNQTFNELPMVDRVDQLTLKVLPNSDLSQEERLTAGLPEKGSTFSAGSMAIYAQLTGVEEQILGRSFGGDYLANRLARLEQRLYGASSSGSIDNRMARVLKDYHAYSPQGSPTYDPRFSDSVNRFMPYSSMSRRMPPGVPEAANSPWQQPTRPNWVSPQGSFRQPGYSPGTPLSGSSQVQLPHWPNPSGFSTVTPKNSAAESSSALDPNPYNSSQAQTDQADEAPPGFEYLPHQRFQAAQPNNQVSVTANSTAGMMQSLTIIESQVFGRSYDGANMLTRLSQLEQKVFGMTYPRYTPFQRINRLLRQTGQNS